MDRERLKKLLKKEAKYLDYLENVSKFPLSHTPKLAEIRMSRAHLQNCYRDREMVNFKRPVVDYLCLVSTKILLIECERLLSMQYKEDPLEIFLDECKRKERDTKNMMRLFLRDPSHVLDSELASKTGRKVIYNAINELIWEVIENQPSDPVVIQLSKKQV